MSKNVNFGFDTELVDLTHIIWRSGVRNRAVFAVSNAWNMIDILQISYRAVVHKARVYPKLALDSLS